MPTPQTTAQNADRISIGSAKIEVQAYTQNPTTDSWVNLGLADDIEVTAERTFSEVEPGNGVNPLPLVLSETATVNFALWEQYFPNLSILDGGLSKTNAAGTKRTLGGGAEIGRLRARFIQLIPRQKGTRDRLTTYLYYGRMSGNEPFQFKNKDDSDPYNRKTIELTFELDPARLAEDRDQLMYQLFQEQFIVTFESNEGSAVPQQLVYDGELATLPDPAPTKEGHTFDGWFADEGLETSFDFDEDAIDDDTTIYAKWEED